VNYAEFQRRLRQHLEEMPEEKAQDMVELLRTKGGKKGQVYAELFIQTREDARRRREANGAAEAFASHMAALTGRQLRPGVTLDEIARAGSRGRRRRARGLEGDLAAGGGPVRTDEACETALGLSRPALPGFRAFQFPPFGVGRSWRK